MLGGYIHYRLSLTHIFFQHFLCLWSEWNLWWQPALVEHCGDDWGVVCSFRKYFEKYWRHWSWHKNLIVCWANSALVFTRTLFFICIHVFVTINLFSNDVKYSRCFSLLCVCARACACGCMRACIKDIVLNRIGKVSGLQGTVKVVFLFVLCILIKHLHVKYVLLQKKVIC